MTTKITFSVVVYILVTLLILAISSGSSFPRGTDWAVAITSTNVVFFWFFFVRGKY
jgi:hypothetical protein